MLLVMLMKKNKVKYYQTYEDNFVVSKKQDFKIKDNYQYIHKNIVYQFGSFLAYLFFLILSLIYCPLFLHVKIKNRKVLKGYKGYFLYANHTQEIGDVLNPILVSFPLHPYYVCSPANLGIPFLGKILPLAGAIPIASNIQGLKKMKEAIFYHIQREKCIVIYPEAHLWPWYTQIRPFPNTSFHFSVESSAPVFVSTTTYQKSKIFKKPKITIYIDGPFMIDDNLTRKENIQKLHDEVYNIMKERSKLSNYEFIQYKKKDV